LPPALARRLAECGHEAEHVSELNLAGAPDSRIWIRAVRARAVILSKDEDFALRAQQPNAAVQVVWIRLGNTTNRALWAVLEPRLDELLQALEAGEKLIEIT
jgi:predicted nuclease of predicted toxin-antitoxin system